jgi:hypothetical protein
MRPYFDVKNGVFWDVALYASCKNRRFASISEKRIGELGTTFAELATDAHYEEIQIVPILVTACFGC